MTGLDRVATQSLRRRGTFVGLSPGARTLVVAERTLGSEDRSKRRQEARGGFVPPLKPGFPKSRAPQFEPKDFVSTAGPPDKGGQKSSGYKCDKYSNSPTPESLVELGESR